MIRLLLLLLALMCENVNAAPQGVDCCRSSEMEQVARVPVPNGEHRLFKSEVGGFHVPPDSNQRPAPFTLSNPMCQTGFTIAMRYDQRNAAGTIIKSVWVRKCVRVPRIVYGRKV